MVPAVALGTRPGSVVERLGLLQAFASDLARADSPTAAGELACATALGGLHATGVVLLGARPDGSLRTIASAGYGPAEVALFKDILPVPEGPGHRALREGGGVFLSDRAQLLREFPDYPSRPVNESWAVIAGACGDQRIVLSLAFERARPFPEEDRAFLTTVALLCAQAMHRTLGIQREREARAHAEQQAAWAQFQASLARELWLEPTAEGVLTRIARMAVPRLATAVAGDLVEPDGLRRVVIAHKDPEGEERAWRVFGQRPKEEEGSVAAYVGRTGQAQYLPSTEPEALRRLSGPAVGIDRFIGLGVRSAMSIPVAGKGGCRAVLTFIHSEAAFTPDDLEEAKEIAVLAGFAISNVTLRQELREAASARLDALRSFAHDVRGPLAVAMLRANSLARRLRGRPTAPADGQGQALPAAAAGGATGAAGTPAPQLDPTDAAWAALERSLERVSNLTDQVMAAARDDAGIAPDLQEVDLGAVASEVAQMLAPLARDRHIDLQVRVAPVRVQADPKLVHSIVENLVTNATKFTRPGGHVTVSTFGAHTTGLLAVRDDGVGWRPEQQPALFEPFARPNRHAAGTGLGLYLARKSALRMAGKLEAQSPGPEHGATFTLELPLAKAAPSGP